MAKDLGRAYVLDIIEFSNKPKRIGRNKVAIPSGFYKMIYNVEKEFQKCFYYENDLKAKTKGDKLKSHVIECKVMLDMARH